MNEITSSPNFKSRLRTLAAISFLGGSSLTGILHGDTIVTSLKPVQVAISHEADKKPNIQINVIGNEECQQDTKAALKLIQTKAPQHFEVVSDYIKIIQCEPSGSGMYADEALPRFVVGDAERNAGTFWYASTIVHDANHSRLYHQYLVSHPSQPVPQDVWKGESAEATCLGAQVDVLERMGAPQRDISYVENVVKTDYWEVPFQNRYW